MLLTPVDCATPPVTPPLITGTGHVYVVPAGTPVGVTVKVLPVVIDSVWLVTAGVEFTVTVAVPEIVFEQVGVVWYVTLTRL